VNQLGNINKTVQKTTGTMSAFKTATSQAAGMLMRDLVRSATAAIGEVFELGAEVQNLRNSFERLTVEAGDTNLTLESLREATRGMVSDVDLLQSANQAMLLGLPTEGLEDMMFAAIKLGSAMGIDAKMAVDSLTTGIGRQSKLMLDNLGILIDTNMAYEEYAISVNKSVAELDESERKLAFQEAAFAAVSEKAASLGDNISDATVQQSQFAAGIENLKTRIGELLEPLAGIAPILEELAPTIAQVGLLMIPQMTTAISGAGGLTAAVTGLGTALKVGLIPAFSSLATILISLMNLLIPVLLFLGIATAEFTEEEIRSIQEMEDAFVGGFDRMGGAAEDFTERFRALQDEFGMGGQTVINQEGGGGVTASSGVSDGSSSAGSSFVEVLTGATFTQPMTQEKIDDLIVQITRGIVENERTAFR